MPTKVQSGYTQRMIVTLLRGDKPKALPAGYGRRVADRFRNMKAQLPIIRPLKSEFFKMELLRELNRGRQLLDDAMPSKLFEFRLEPFRFELPNPLELRVGSFIKLNPESFRLRNELLRTYLPGDDKDKPPT